MDYQNVYDYSKDISQSLGLSVKWVHADKSWLNLTTPDDGLTCWSLPFTSSMSFVPNFSRSWNLSFIFYQQDAPDSDMDQNDQSAMQESIRTLSNTDRAVNMFIRLFESNSLTTALDLASQKLLVTSSGTEPAIRDTAQLLTGTLLTMTVQFPDNFDYCCLTDAT
jgi:hypothetical protein